MKISNKFTRCFLFILEALFFMIIGAYLYKSGAISAFMTSKPILLIKKNLLGMNVVTFIPEYPDYSILDWDREYLMKLQPKFIFEGNNLTEWQKFKRSLLPEVNKILRFEKMPKDFPLKAKIVERVELKEVLREKILLETEEGLKIPLFFLIPKNKTFPLPAILVIPGHGVGKIGPAGLVDDYQNKNALYLAKNGFITVVPDLRGFGELGWKGVSSDPIYQRDMEFNLIVGRNPIGVLIYDCNKIIEYMFTRKEIDTHKIGVTGCSLGGILAGFIGALNENIDAVFISATSFLEKDLRRDNVSLMRGDNVSLNSLLEFSPLTDKQTILQLIAPRPLFIDIDESKINNKNDIIGYVRVKEIYGLYGKENNFKVIVHNRGHSYSTKEAVNFFNKYLTSCNR
ncbi:MAG: alpha/beta hydrolase family protein [bacterium]